MPKNRVAATLLLALSVSVPAVVQAGPLSAPAAAPLAPSMPDAADVPYPGGAMRLEIDATDTVRGAYRVTQTIPVAPNTTRLTLLLPQWLPGNHGPRGTMAELVDLQFFAGSKKLSWKRDPVEVFAFHVDVLAGTT